MLSSRSAHRAVRAALSLGLALCLVATVSPAAGFASSVDERLRRTRDRVEQVREELRRADARRASDAAALDKAEAHVADVLQAVEQAELAVERQQARVAEARDHLDELRQASRRQREVTADRLAAIYKRGAAAKLDSVLTAGSPAEAVRRTAFVELVTRSDEETLESLTASAAAVDAQEDQLAREQAQLNLALAEEEALLAQAEQLRQERAVVLADSRARVGELREQERHLQAESAELAELARKAAERERLAAARTARTETSRSATEESGPAAARSTGGGWVWPASGPLTSRYGPRWGRMHEGIDIGAGTGSPIVAARAGTVSFAGRMGGYGNLVLINHGGGLVSAYGHQSRIMVSTGQSVSAGQRIGSVGCTGSCTGPHLHFEIRVGGAARNPLGYLR